MAKKEEAQERIEETNPDLPYELQSRLFEQFATFGLGGAGLSITLASSLLQGSPLVWMATASFAIAAVQALAGQQGMIERLFKRQAARATIKLSNTICAFLIGIGVGTLAAGAFDAVNAAGAG
jgi:hypothetical protein